MATRFKACSIDGCNRNAHRDKQGRNGMCKAHYRRLRIYGDPLVGRTMDGEPMEWLLRHRDFQGDECLPWPYNKNEHGQGQLRQGDGNIPASRMMCILAHGDPPSHVFEAAHSCGNGHLACCNQNHLRWATKKENAADRTLHGTQGRGSKNGHSILTDDDVHEIRRLRGFATFKQLAERFHVHPSCINDIMNGRTWAWLVTPT
ncbi:hypothetical protein [Rhizobium azibense]|uniref:HNH endonuclease n=1 Tax=Rhizobium azibense TaxID=1136135 RepID=A0A4R3RRD5_9HYPH|nr:hypothetical protein [Rhizobium azibense]TCU34166.1 hypothetical protein EV129_113151 [Rhizobium azibense]